MGQRPGLGLGTIQPARPGAGAGLPALSRYLTGSFVACFHAAITDCVHDLDLFRARRSRLIHTRHHRLRP
jgi:hypothetical protein